MANAFEIRNGVCKSCDLFPAISSYAIGAACRYLRGVQVIPVFNITGLRYSLFCLNYEHILEMLDIKCIDNC